MNIKINQLPDEVGELKSFCMKLIADNNRLENALRLMGHRNYGVKSESWIHPGMKTMFPGLQEDESKRSDKSIEKEKSQSDQAKKTPRRNKPEFPAGLEREDVLVDLDEGDKTCSCCGSEKPLKKVSEHITEKLHYEPAKIIIKRFIKSTYSCSGCESMKAAKMPPHPLPKISATLESLATIAVSKYCDSLPLYRQEHILARSGILLSRDNMARWMIQISDVLRPIYNILHQMQIEFPLMLIDETRLQVLKEPGRKAHLQSFLIAKVREGPPGQKIVLFHYSPSRSAEAIAPLLDGFSGVLLSDGLKVYEALVRDRKSIVHCGCWAHCRRKFVDAAKALKPAEREESRAGEMIKLIDVLFDIEAGIADSSAEERSKVREQRCRPHLDIIRAWLDQNQEKTPRKSPLGVAMNYLDEQWEKLTRFIDYPQALIHNNTTEQQIRPVALGRKNFLFCDTVAGAKATAILYSLISTAKINGLNPHQYLIDALSGLASGKPAADLLPLQQ